MSPLAEEEFVTIRSFIILIDDEIELDQVQEYSFWTQTNKVAKVSDEELRLHGVKPLKKSANLKSQRPNGRLKVKFDLTPKPLNSQLFTGSKPNNLIQTSPETPKRQLHSSKRLSSSSSSSPSPPRCPREPAEPSPPPSPPPKGRLVVPLGTLPDPQHDGANKVAQDINLRRLQLADLIPADIQILDLDSVSLWTPRLRDGDESDSVSYIASSGSSDGQESWLRSPQNCLKWMGASCPSESSSVSCRQCEMFLEPPLPLTPANTLLCY